MRTKRALLAGCLLIGGMGWLATSSGVASAHDLPHEPAGVHVDNDSPTTDTYGRKNRERHLVLNLVGSAPMYEDTVPDIDGDGADDPAMCFDADLIDQRRDRKVGTATDCLSNVTEIEGGLSVVGTTYFNLPSGTLITRGNTTVQPVLTATTLPSGETITHITGAAATGNSVIGGTHRWANSEGTARLSGMVDMTDFGGEPGDPIYFNCVFILDVVG